MSYGKQTFTVNNTTSKTDILKAFPKEDRDRVVFFYVGAPNNQYSTFNPDYHKYVFCLNGTDLNLRKGVSHWTCFLLQQHTPEAKYLPQEVVQSQAYREHASRRRRKIHAGVPHALDEHYLYWDSFGGSLNTTDVAQEFLETRRATFSHHSEGLQYQDTRSDTCGEWCIMFCHGPHMLNDGRHFIHEVPNQLNRVEALRSDDNLLANDYRVVREANALVERYNTNY